MEPVSWIELSIGPMQVFEWLEFFAGLGNLTRAMKSARYKSARFDLLDNQKPQHRKSNFMDLNSPSGFAILVCFKQLVYTWIFETGLPTPS